MLTNHWSGTICDAKWTGELGDIVEFLGHLQLPNNNVNNNVWKFIENFVHTLPEETIPSVWQTCSSCGRLIHFTVITYKDILGGYGHEWSHEYLIIEELP